MQRELNHPNKSPLRYPGGKTRACKLLYEIADQHFSLSSCDTLLSPFFGGGSFEFHMANRRPQLRVCANDKFVPLYQFWNQAKENNDALCERIRARHDGGTTKEVFAAVRNSIMDEGDPLQQAADYFVLNRCSFSGATLSGGYSQAAATNRFTESSIERVGRLDLGAFDFYNDDFERFLAQHYTPNSLLFLDPPYYLEKSTLYGKNGDMHEHFDHQRLFAALQGKRWMMTYNNSPYIRELYHEHTIIEAAWSYGMNKSKQSSEIVIVSGSR